MALIGHADEASFATACETRRIILTRDSDFLDDQRFPFHRNPGVVVLLAATGNGTLEIALADHLRILTPRTATPMLAPISSQQTIENGPSAGILAPKERTLKPASSCIQEMTP